LVTIAGLLAVALVLIAVYRSARRALVPLIPIVLATGWSSLILWITRVPLNPMSATLGALVIAIATEFSVLLSARYYEERVAGGSLGEALRRAFSRTGAAVAASGVTAIAGFAVLAFTNIRMLRDFGLVTVFDLGVALLGVLLVLPAALVWAEGGFQPVGTLSARMRRRGRPAPADVH
jgi:predicted RND superfamily exporter protein